MVEDTEKPMAYHGEPNTGDQGQPGKAKRRVHPAVTWNYFPRLIGFFLASLILVAVYYDSQGPLIWVIVLVPMMLWPQVAYLLGRTSHDPVRTEFRSMCIESFAGGCFIVILAFRPWPSVAMTIGMLVNTLASGGIRLTLKALLAYAAGMGLALGLVGFDFISSVSVPVMLTSMLFILLYSSLVSFMSYSFLLRLRESRQYLREAHSEIQDKLDQMRREILERQRVEGELRAAMDRAESAGRAKSRFLANMSHEIRTPMNAIIGMTDLALSARTDAAKDDYLVTVKDATRHLLAVVNDILDFSRIESGRLRLENEDVDLPELVGSIVKTMHFHAAKKDLSLTVEVADGVPRFVHCDPSRLRQILFNIIGNALKFTEAGSVNVTVAPCREAETGERCTPEGARWVVFTVEDTGIGIPADQLESIFDSFHQVENDKQRIYGGTGLGLPISRKIVDQMGGRIWVESRPGMGSRFHFSLPLPEGREVTEGVSSDLRSIIAQPGHRRLNLLLVEDNAINIRFTRAVLERLGHHAVVAENGAVALEALRAFAFDAVLMDIEMPVMDGIEATGRIRAGEAGESNADLPVLAMTAHVFDEVMAQCEAAGVTATVAKPIDVVRLAQMLQEVAAGR